MLACFHPLCPVFSCRVCAVACGVCVHMLGTRSLDTGLLYFVRIAMSVLMCPGDEGGCCKMVRYRVTVGHADCWPD